MEDSNTKGGWRPHLFPLVASRQDQHGSGESPEKVTHLFLEKSLHFSAIWR